MIPTIHTNHKQIRKDQMNLTKKLTNLVNLEQYQQSKMSNA